MLAPLSVVDARGLSSRVLHAEAARRFNPLEKLKNAVNSSLESAKRVGGSVKERVERPLMSQISNFRIMMCYQRGDLLRHKECMAFMVEKCSVKSTGQGLCEKLFVYVIKHCQDEDKDACHYAELLGLTVPDKEDKEEDEHEPEAKHELEPLMEEMKDPCNGFNNADCEEPCAWDEKKGKGLCETPLHGDYSDTNATNATNATVIVANVTAGPTGIDKKIRGLPKQGYNEYGNGTVEHKDLETHTSDWGEERPVTDESEEEATARACKKTPDTVWCKLYLKRHEARATGGFGGGASSNQDCDAYMTQIGCGWTSDENCPGQQMGKDGMAWNDGSVAFECCCIQGLWQT